MASVARQEEQGFDVNVTSHLLVDTVTGTIDAAVVINNDRDFAYPSHAPENDSQLAWSIPRRGIGQASSPAGRTRGRAITGGTKCENAHQFWPHRAWANSSERRNAESVGGCHGIKEGIEGDSRKG